MIGQISSRTCENIYIIFTGLDLFKKLPKDKQDFIENNRDEKYRFNFDKKKPVQFQIKDKETMVVLSYLFLKYINKNPETKKALLDTYKSNEIRYQKKLREKYNSDNIFLNTKNNDKKDNAKINEEQVALIEYKESIVTKLIKRIKKFLNKKK